MSKELIVSATRHETRVAVLEEDQVVEIYHQREKEYSLAGSIHKGRVTRVLPGMQSAFVDIGLERDAFLYVSDFFEDNEEYDQIVSTVEEKVLRLETGEGAGAVTSPAASSLGEGPILGPLPVDAPLPNGKPREERGERGERGDRGRGGRGRRRGRGRVPGQSGGLPESKYFSPREQATEPSGGSAERPAPEVRQSAVEVADDFAVLPGESLAKYGGDADPEPFRDGSEPLAVDPVNAVEERVTPEGPIEEDLPFQVEELEPQPAISLEIFEVPVSELGAPDESLGNALEVAPTIKKNSQEALGEETSDEVILAERADSEEDGEPEGAEPAPGPASLTATVRDPGARYQHRVSRRMRRKMRGGAGQEERRPEKPAEQSTQPYLEPASSENVSVQDVRMQETSTPVLPEAAREEMRAQRPPLPSISDLLREGQEIIVQIAKEPLGQKGARITSHVALPGRFLVYMPSVDHVGVSRKIPSDEERLRLKRILQTHRTGMPGGFIVRTAGEGKSEEELRSDMMFLYNLWLDMRQKAEKRPAPLLMHHDLDLVQRILRDQLTTSFKTVWVDNEELYESILRFVQRFQPAMVSRVKLYTRPTSIFDEFGVTAELEKALRPKVWLKSGGYIVINQTEALVAIDINTGKYVGKSNRLEDTIVKTNTDAIKEIVRQIRLRDLGGIIVVDFIDMDERKNRQKVMQALEEAMRVDRAPYKILQFNDFGLVAITRKRVKQSLERTLCSPCPYCEGAGSVKSVQTVIGEILAEAHKYAKVVDGTDVMLRVNPEVAKVLKSNQNDFLQEIEETLGKTVMVKSDPLLHQTKFDLA